MYKFSLGNFISESNQLLENVEIAYHIFGELAPEKKVIWVCHALTANSDAQDWWPNFIGENLTLDTEKYTIVCANILGSCYGTSFQKQEKLPG